MIGSFPHIIEYAVSVLGSKSVSKLRDKFDDYTCKWNNVGKNQIAMLYGIFLSGAIAFHELKTEKKNKKRTKKRTR